MSMHLQRQITKLKKAILTQGSAVEERLSMALLSVQNRDVKLAEQVMAADDALDEMDVEIEEECLHALALHQPVAFDLRFIVAILKINGDLERIGDLTTTIGAQAHELANEPELNTLPLDVAALGAEVRLMLKRSLDAMVNIDMELADQVRLADDSVDAVHRKTYRNVEKGIRKYPQHTGQFIRMVSISRSLERIADHCVNIADDVIYMAKGDITRHARPHTSSGGDPDNPGNPGKEDA